MYNLEAPELAEAYDAVRDDKNPINYLIVSFAAATGNNLDLALTGTGEGGLDELKEKLDDTQAQYAYCRIEYANDTESTRVKFVFIAWIGAQTNIMRKARVGVVGGELQKHVIRHSSLSVNAYGKDDLDEAEIVKLCRKAGGADYNGGRG